jgi:hypothetical protein
VTNYKLHVSDVIHFWKFGVIVYNTKYSIVLLASLRIHTEVSSTCIRHTQIIVKGKLTVNYSQNFLIYNEIYKEMHFFKPGHCGGKYQSQQSL